MSATRTKVVHILGASGSGTTTLGKALHHAFDYAHYDADDYFWLPTDPPFTAKRDITQRQQLILDDIAKVEKCVVTGSLCGWGDVLIPHFTLVVYLYTSKDLRISRLKKREYELFGDRILEGGDMYEINREFIEWAGSYDTADEETRSHKMHARWLRQIRCPILELDGSSSTRELLNPIRAHLV